jgi:uncharacterized membrane protein
MRKWLPASLIAVAWAVSFALFDRLPVRIPTHWNLGGQVDGWSARTAGAFGMPALMLVIWGVCYWLPAIDPRRVNYARFRDTYDTVVAAVLGVMLVTHGSMLAIALGVDLPVPILIPLTVGVLLVVIGNLLPRARPNWFFGIRTPWTLSNDRVWERTHRVGGRVMVIAGILVAVSGFAAGPWLTILIPIAAVGAAIIPVVYSYIVWRGERHQ